MENLKLVEQFLLALTRSGAKHDILGPCSDIATRETDWRGEAGMKLKRSSNTWHWMNFQLGEHAYIGYSHSYSQATGRAKGKSSRAWRYRIRMRRAIEKVVGVKPSAYAS